MGARAVSLRIGHVVLTVPFGDQKLKLHEAEVA